VRRHRMTLRGFHAVPVRHRPLTRGPTARTSIRPSTGRRGRRDRRRRRRRETSVTIARVSLANGLTFAQHACNSEHSRHRSSRISCAAS
jgi:hypothetical protein